MGSVIHDTHSKSSGIRSPHWHATRDQHLAKEPVCQVCGRDDHLQVHHIRPFHLKPDLELDQGNLITLCEHPARNCHHTFGHIFDWHSFNAKVVRDAELWREKVKHRPSGGEGS